MIGCLLIVLCTSGYYVWFACLDSWAVVCTDLLSLLAGGLVVLLCVLFRFLFGFWFWVWFVTDAVDAGCGVFGLMVVGC